MALNTLSGVAGNLALEYREVQSLKNHPRNAPTFGELSGDADCEEFVESIRKAGRIRTPLTITPDGVVVSGHRRRQGGARAGLKKLPCIVDYSLTTPEAVDQAWSDANLNRVMTEEQRARFYQARKEIESIAAKARQGNIPKNFTEGRKSGEAAGIAAEAVGWSRPTAEKAAKVVQVIDELTASGETLNTKSVSAAAKKAEKATAAPAPEAEDSPEDANGLPIPDHLREVFDAIDDFDSGRHHITQAVKCFNRLHDGDAPAGALLRTGARGQSVIELLKKASGAFRFSTPHCVCANCGGKPKGCDVCGHRGWMSEQQFKDLPGVHKGKLAQAGGEGPISPPPSGEDSGFEVVAHVSQMNRADRTRITEGLDQLDAVVPESLQPVFEVVPRFKNFLSLISKAKFEFRQLKDSPGGGRLRNDIADVGLTNIYTNVKCAMPYCLCPKPRKDHNGCDTCKGHGWITKELHDRISNRSTPAQAL